MMLTPTPGAENNALPSGASLRRALYMPALVASRVDMHAKAFYEAFTDARHKARLQALVAVARKLLHAIYGIFRNGTAYDGSKLFTTLLHV